MVAVHRLTQINTDKKDLQTEENLIHELHENIRVISWIFFSCSPEQMWGRLPPSPQLPTAQCLLLLDSHIVNSEGRWQCDVVGSTELNPHCLTGE